jgi:hypothetical protein
MEIKLTATESESIFYDALCNGLFYIDGYGLEFDYQQTDYEKAKKELKKQRGEKEELCREDVWMEILRIGGKLTLIDHECEGEYTRSITLKDVHDRVNLTPADHLLAMYEEQGDAGTADSVLQSVFYKEIIFG